MLAAIPSVILGFWGILVLAPFVHEHIEPCLHDTLGFIPIFGAPETTGSSVFTASLILTIMVIPIIASISRDLFLAVPRDAPGRRQRARRHPLGGGARGGPAVDRLRAWSPPRCSASAGPWARRSRSSQVIGAGSEIQASLFKTGDTLASRIANQFPGALTELHKASLFYCGVILLVIGLLSNLVAQWIGRRFSYEGAAAR